MKSELDALLQGEDFDEEDATAEEEETEETEELEPEEESEEDDSEEEDDEETEEDSEEDGSTAEPETSGKDSSETEETWTKAAYLDEKRKRQENEQQLAQLRAELEALKNPPEMEELDYSKPEQVASAIQGRAELIATQKVVNLSRAMVKKQHDDYDAMETVFANAAKQDPSLVNQMIANENPAEFAYKTGKKLSLMQEMGDDPDAYIAKKVAEQLAASKPKEPEKPKPKKKPSLAKTPSVSGSSTSGDSLEDILGR